MSHVPNGHLFICLLAFSPFLFPLPDPPSLGVCQATGLPKLPSQRGAHAVISIVGMGPVVHQSNKHVASLVHTFHDPAGDKARREATAIGTIKKELTRACSS